MGESTLRIFGAPHRYVQGPGALDRLGPLVADLGPRAVLIVDAGVSAFLAPRLPGDQYLEVDLEVTHAAIEATLARVTAGPAVIVGVGGGKAVDLARAVAWRRGDPLVTVPTVASNDSPAAMAVAVYDDEHRMVEVIQTGRNPELVLVDTAVIARAPVRLLAAGIGDAVAKKFEARSCLAVGGTNQHGTRGLRVAAAIADACYENLRISAVAGLAAARRGEPDAAFEDMVEATILLSGLAFENGGLSIAHSFVRGLQAVRGTRDALHGEHVGYGLLVQLALEGGERPELTGFLAEVGLPVTLAGLGLPDASDDERRELAERCVASPHRHKTPAVVDVPAVLAAIAAVEGGTQ
ncbi:glycerol dehydrogenase [Cryptosporangium japonicum]|uniref:Glycerol dehydrogenase n=1 Tax=Cryptosporangium japonicum TaxID=80872 RepID=A0ABP3EPH0_9ACTN